MTVEQLTHQPTGYECPLCRFARGEFDELNAESDLVAREGLALARISPKWWPNNSGHVLVSPIEHIENLYSMPCAVGHAVFDLVQSVAIAMRQTYGCNGISTRQHNEPAGDQDLWHYHVHVFPRFDNDQLYNRHDDAGYVSTGVRAPYAQLLRSEMLRR